MGIIDEIYDMETTTRGSISRDVAITDKTKTTIIATMWSSEAENFKANIFDSIILRNSIVVEYQGIKKLNCLNGSLIWVNI